MGRGNASRVFGGIRKRRDYLEETGVDVKIILRWLFRKWYAEAWTGSSWLRIGKDGWNL
jgi:hypothetical protein